MGSITKRLLDEAHYVTNGARLIQHFVQGRPFLCNWQVTYRCNFKCDICSFWRETRTAADELTVDGVARVAERLRPLAPLVISMAGGEPLMRKDLPEIARILSKDHYFTLITNGFLLTRELAEKLYANGLGDIHVSLDYATAERHDAQRKHPGAFEKAVQAVEILRDTRPDRRHRVHIMTTVLDDNVDELEGLLQLAERLGVSLEVSLYSHRRGQKALRYPKAPVSDLLRRLKVEHPATFVSFDDYLAGFDRAVTARDMPSCRAGGTFLNIDDRGQVSRCIDTNDQPVGSLLEEPAEAILGKLRAQSEADPCGQCWTSCRGFGDIMVGPVGVARSLPDFYRAVRPL